MRRWLLLGCVLAACGGGTTALTPETYGSAYAAAECKQLVACGVSATQADCEAVTAPLDTVSLVAAATAKTVVFSATAAAQCTAAIGARSCDQNNQDNRIAPTACAQVFVGSAAVGSACEIGAECASGACQVPSCGSACCEGTCLAIVQDVALGGACTTSEQCAVGGYCDVNVGSASGVCATLLATNALCTSADQCDYGLGCIGGDGAGEPPGLCGPGPHAGDACNDMLCSDIGVSCNSKNACVQVGLVGDVCGSMAVCSPQLECTASNMCGTFPGVGKACAGTCDDTSYCQLGSGSDSSTGTCLAQQDNGATCADDLLQCTSRVLRDSGRGGDGRLR